SLIDLRRGDLEGRLMALGQDPGLERKARRVRSQRKKSLILANDAHAGLRLLMNDVAENAALFVDVILFRTLQFLDHVFGHDGQRDELSVPVFQRRAGQGSVVLEDENVLEAAVL